MRLVVLKLLMGVMIFCSLESAVDASAVTSHHGDSSAHEVHHGPGPAPDHEDEDCSHFCHCTAHLPVMAIVGNHNNDTHAGRPMFCVSARIFSSRVITPPLRPPIS